MYLAAVLLQAIASPQGMEVLPNGYDRHSRVHHDVDVDGTHWARGRGYKASAGEAGFAFIPFLGSDAPTNYPVRMRLTEVTRGGESLGMDGVLEVARKGDRVVLDRGAVRVRYDLMPEGVEQSFEIDAMLGEGNLVLNLGVTTELEVSEQGRGFRFSNERGGCDYGGAVVFDAAGARVDVDASWAKGGIALTVPAAFLDEAEWPIVVDPLLTPFTIQASTADLTHPDAAHDILSNRFSVVFEERFSGTDVDVFTYYIGATGDILAGGYVDQTTASWTGPRVSVTRGPGDPSKTFVVAQGDSLAVPGSTDIVSRVRQSDGSFLPSVVMQSATSSYGCAAPDVGVDGDPSAGTGFLVAYNRVYPTHRDIYVFHPTPTGAGMNRPVASRLTHDSSAPAVSNTSGTCCFALYYIVGWSERELATGASSVRAARVRYDLSSPPVSFTVAGPSSTALYFDVAVSSTSSQELTSFFDLPYLVTYDDRLASVTDALVAVCSQTTVHNTYELQLSEHADRAPNQNDLKIATGTDQFMLGYEEGGELHMTSVATIGEELSILERRSIAVGSDLVPGSLSVADVITFGSQNARGLFVWSQAGATSSSISGAFASVPTSFTPSAGVQYCYGEVNSTGERGFIRARGTRNVGSPITLHVENLPANAFGYYLASLFSDNVMNAGGSQGTLCLGGNIGRFGIYQASAAGTASGSVDSLQIAQPTGPVAATAGQRWRFQSWHRDGVMGVATSNFTNAVVVPFM